MQDHYLKRCHTLGVGVRGRTDTGTPLAPGEYEGVSLRTLTDVGGKEVTEGATYWLVSNGAWHVITRSVAAGLIKILETRTG
jgi:hypothetical protein